MTKVRLSVAAVTAIAFVVAARAQTPTDVKSAPAASATGTVVGPDSKPQPGVPVQVIGPQGNKTTAFTDKNGSWSLYNLAPGNYQVRLGAGVTTTNNKPIDFTIKQTGFFTGLFGTTPTYNAAIMKLDKDWMALTPRNDAN